MLTTIATSKNIGINVRSVRTYARQLFTALRHLASLGVVIFTLFPLVSAWVVCLPWALVCCFVLGRWVSGLTLLAVMMLLFGGDQLRPEAELQLHGPLASGNEAGDNPKPSPQISI